MKRSWTDLFILKIQICFLWWRKMCLKCMNFISNYLIHSLPDCSHITQTFYISIRHSFRNFFWLWRHCKSHPEGMSSQCLHHWLHFKMWSVSILGLFLIMREKYNCFDPIFQESPGLCRYALICGVFLLRNAAIVFISSGEFMDTLMACCVWWLFKQDINQQWKEQCTEWKRIWSVELLSPPQKQDEA